MDIGRADRRIKIERRVETKDGMGQVIEDYTPITRAPEMWATVLGLSGRELFAAQQVNSEITTRFTIRFRDDLDTKMRIVYDGQHYDIHYIREAPGGRRRSTEILASARV